MEYVKTLLSISEPYFTLKNHIKLFKNNLFLMPKRWQLIYKINS